MADGGHSNADSGTAPDTNAVTAAPKASSQRSASPAPDSHSAVCSPVPRFDLLVDNSDDRGREGDSAVDTSVVGEASDRQDRSVQGDSVSLPLRFDSMNDDTQSNWSGYPQSLPHSLHGAEDVTDPLSFHTSAMEDGSLSYEEPEIKHSTPACRTKVDFASQRDHHTSKTSGMITVGDIRGLPAFLDSAIQVFDMRGRNCALVQGRALTINNRSSSQQLKEFIALRFNTEERHVVIWSPDDTFGRNRCAILLDEEQMSMLKLFLSESAVNLSDPFFHPRPEWCVCGDEKCTPEYLLQLAVSSSKKFENTCLVWNKNVLKNHTFADYKIQDFSTLEIIQVRSLTVNILHRHSTFILHCYVLDVLNVDSIRDMKAKFLQRFADHFPSVVSGSDVLAFTRGTTLLQEDEFPHVGMGPTVDDTSSDSYDLDSTSQLMVHVKPSSAVKAVLSYRLEGVKKNRKEAVLLDPTASPTSVREVAARVCHKPPNSLKVLVQGKKIQDLENISQCPDFVPDCSMVAESQPKVEIQVVVRFLPGGRESRRRVLTYKHDSVGALRRELAEVLGVDPFHLNLTTQGGQLLEDFRSIRECRLRRGDEILALVHQKRALIRIRQAGKINDVLLIDDISSTTVQQVIEFTREKHGLTGGNLYLSCNRTRLHGPDTLESTSVQSGSTVLVCLEDDPLPSNLQYLFEAVDQEKIITKILIVSPSGQRFPLQFPEGTDPTEVAAAFAQPADSSKTGHSAVPGVKALSDDTVCHLSAQDPSRGTSRLRSDAVMDHMGKLFPSGSAALTRSVSAMPSLSYTSLPCPETSNTSVPESYVDSSFVQTESMSIQSSEVSSSFSGMPAASCSKNSLQTSTETRLEAYSNTSPSIFRSRSCSASDHSRTAFSQSRGTSERTESPETGKLISREVHTQRMEIFERGNQRYVKNTRIHESPLPSSEERHRHLKEYRKLLALSPIQSPGVAPHGEMHPGMSHSRTFCNLEDPPGVVENSLLNKMATVLGHNWAPVCLALGLDNVQLDQIREKHRNDLHMQAEEGLRLWKVRMGRDATPAALKQILLQCNCRLFAEMIDSYMEDRYQTA